MNNDPFDLVHVIISLPSKCQLSTISGMLTRDPRLAHNKIDGDFARTVSGRQVILLEWLPASPVKIISNKPEMDLELEDLILKQREIRSDLSGLILNSRMTLKTGHPNGILPGQTHSKQYDPDIQELPFRGSVWLSNKITPFPGTGVQATSVCRF